MFDSDGDILPQFRAQDDAVVDTHQFEPTLTDYESRADNDKKAVYYREAILPKRLGNIDWYGRIPTSSGNYVSRGFFVLTIVNIGDWREISLL